MEDRPDLGRRDVQAFSEMSRLPRARVPAEKMSPFGGSDNPKEPERLQGASSRGWPRTGQLRAAGGAGLQTGWAGRGQSQHGCDQIQLAADLVLGANRRPGLGRVGLYALRENGMVTNERPFRPSAQFP